SSNTVTSARAGSGTARPQVSTPSLHDALPVTFSGLSYNKAETMDIAFTSNASGVSAATSSNIVVSPAAVSQLVITQQPAATATAGVAFSTQPIAPAEHAFGHVVTSESTHTVTA